jgi:hypothetical protein
VHEPEELAGAGGERFDVPPLPFSVQRGPGRERRFSGPGDPCDHDELVPGDRDADIFEVVLAGPLMMISFIFGRVQVVLVYIDVNNGFPIARKKLDTALLTPSYGSAHRMLPSLQYIN